MGKIDHLHEPTLFGTTDLVETAIKRIQTFEGQALELDPEGYWLAFSGGKDSVVVHDLARKAGVKFTANYSVTTVDAPELLRFMKDNYPDLIWHYPETNMYDLIRKKGLPPTRRVRYCCEILKERGGEGKLLITGVRWAESARRAKRRMMERCSKYRTKVYLHPIIDWPDAAVWQYIKQNNLPYCSLYDEGFKRVGCVGCPLTTKVNRLRELERWPRFAANYRRAIDDAFRDTDYSNRKLQFASSQEMWDWWLDDPEEHAPECQLGLYDD